MPVRDSGTRKKLVEQIVFQAMPRFNDVPYVSLMNGKAPHGEWTFRDSWDTESARGYYLIDESTCVTIDQPTLRKHIHDGRKWHSCRMEESQREARQQKASAKIARDKYVDF